MHMLHCQQDSEEKSSDSKVIIKSRYKCYNVAWQIAVQCDQNGREQRIDFNECIGIYRSLLSDLYVDSGFYIKT